jgi:hypothetical protein
MLDRRIRRAGVRLIEAALSKLAVDGIFNPTLGTLKAKKTRELNSASAEVPKILTLPTS